MVQGRGNVFFPQACNDLSGEGEKKEGGLIGRWEGEEEEEEEEAAVLTQEGKKEKRGRGGRHK